MTKLNGESFNIEEKNIKELLQLFPEVETDGKIDIEKLKQVLGNYVDDSDERYRFTWNGKGEALRISQTPSLGTLRPDKESSKHWDETENLYIEGDNLEVLKLLQKSYFGKVKMIYIDPPYNTGGDFVYKDDYKDNLKNYKEMTGQVDSEGKATTTNREYSGRYHTDWLNMMYPRLRLARNLLKEDGVIFISIDDKEVVNLKKVADEIFGEKNFIANIIVEGTPKNDPYIISTAHEYCLVYVKDFSKAIESSWGLKNPLYKNLYNITDKSQNYIDAEKKLVEYYTKNKLNKDNISNYKYVDEKGIFRLGPIDDPQESGLTDVRYHPITKKKLKTPNSGWRCTIDTWNKWIEEDLIYFPNDENKLCAKKTYLDINRLDLLRATQKFQTRKDTDYLKKIFDGKSIFSYPKPKDLIKLFIENSCHDNEIVLDFFAGSSTTAHAVMEANVENNSNIKFILVQLPENLKEIKPTRAKEKKVLNNAIGFLEELNVPANLCEIGKERIRRTGDLVKRKLIQNNKEEELLNIDIGFKCFKLDTSNIKEWNPDKHDSIQTAIEDFETPYVAGRTDFDVVYEMMLKMGLDLSLPIEEVEVNGKSIYSIGMGLLMICLDEAVNLDIANKMIEIKNENDLDEFRVIFRDEGFENDTVKTNIKETLRSAGLAEESFITL